MTWTRLCGAVLATLGVASAAQAGLFGQGCGSSKSCGCAAECQPACCRPRIYIPCEPNVYTYQRQKSCAAPPCCTTCSKPACCTSNACPAPVCCAPARCAPACRTSCRSACGSSCGSSKQGLLARCGLFGKGGCGSKGCSNNCSSGCRTAGCQTCCCAADPCEIARLIYESQTACYAKHRRKAIDELGDTYCCKCNPEIMSAFIYALNDADERVRAEAAEEIGDQLESQPCCCCPEVISALSCALGDCDRKVVKKARGALELCGYDVLDSCCEQAACTKPCCTKPCCTKRRTCCTTGCPTGCPGGCANGACNIPVMDGVPPAGETAPDAVPPMPGESTPAPMPPMDPQAIRPTGGSYPQPVPVPQRQRKSLADLLGLAD